MSAILTARDAARDLIFPYVQRGDSLQSLVDGQQGYYGHYRAQIGGYLCKGEGVPRDERCRHIGAHQIAARTHDGAWEVFSLDALYAEIARELAGEPVQKALL